MKNILVPFDFSITATAAFDLAIDIAKKQKTMVNLLYIVVDPFAVQNRPIPTPEIFGNIDARKFLESMKKETIAKLKNIINNSGSAGVKINPFVEYSSSVYNGILKFADRKKTGLIVMGTHGLNNFKSRLLGTNTERVFRLTKIPVLIVKNKVISFNFKKIVFASDLEFSSKNVFNQAWKIMKVYDAKTDILRINSNKDSLRRSYAIGKMKSLTKKYSGNFDFNVIDYDTVEDGISNYCDKLKTDLIVIGVHRKKGFKRLFSDKVSEAIIRVAKQPVLTIDISSN